MTEAKPRKTIIEGSKMRCPRCEELFPLLAWRPLEEVEAYAKETTPIYKCRKSMTSVNKKHGCGFLFAPAEYEPNRELI